MPTISRLTLRKAVEQIAREMDGPRSLADITQEAVERSGRTLTNHTPRTVANHLARLNFIIRCDPDTYAPARVVLDGKAFRVPLTAADIARERLSKTRLEPFYTALGEPPVYTEDGQELATVYVNEELMQVIRAAVVKAAAQALRELAWTDRLFQRADPEKMLEASWKDNDLSRFDSGTIDLSPLQLAAPASEDDEGAEANEYDVFADLIVRWDAQAGALIATAAIPAGAGDAEAIEAEDQVLADFIASKLPRDYALPLNNLLLKAYAHFPELGRTPGSAPLDVIERDPRMRLTYEDLIRPGEAAVARATMMTYQEKQRSAGADHDDEWIASWAEDLRKRIKEHPRKLEEAWDREWRRLGLDRRPRPTNVVPIRKPTNEELMAEWDEALRQQGLSDKVRERKMRHLDTFVYYLESEGTLSPSHLLDVDEWCLESFFFWTYIRRFPNSPSDAVSFTLDLRDFYRYQERLGRIPDARFAELIHRLREFIVERIELYEGLLVLANEGADPELYETLFIG